MDGNACSAVEREKEGGELQKEVEPLLLPSQKAALCSTGEGKGDVAGVSRPQEGKCSMVEGSRATAAALASTFDYCMHGIPQKVVAMAGDQATRLLRRAGV